MPPFDTPAFALWRHPPNNGKYAPLVVFLHGRGADEYDLFSLADRLPRSCRYLALRGFLPVSGGGFTWFENHGAGRPISKSIRESVLRLRSLLDATVSQCSGSIYLVGFSAGMMMAGALILDDPQRFSGAILLSGALPLESGIPAPQDRLSGLPIFYARGTLDVVMPAVLVTQTETYLRSHSGAALTVREYPHAHSISLREIDDIARWLAERL